MEKAGDIFLTPQWMPKTVDSTEPVYTGILVFSVYIYTYDKAYFVNQAQ